jgi:predicted amidohydrolase
MALIGIAQMLVSAGKPDDNIARAGSMIAGAARKGCEIVVLPECLDLGWTYPEAARAAEPIPGKYSDKIAEYAEENAIYVVAGLTEKAHGPFGEAVYNAAVLISPEGTIILKNRKINILDIAQHIYSTGNLLSTVRTPFATIGVDICADNFPSSYAIGHTLARMGAELICSPSAWAVDADHDNEKEPYGDLWCRAYTALARYYRCAVVGVSNVGWIEAGPWKGKKCIGSSLAVGPDGDVLFQAPYGVDAEGLFPVEVSIVYQTLTGTKLDEEVATKNSLKTGSGPGSLS